MAGKFLSLEETARQLGVSVDAVNILVDRKKLFSIRDGATHKFKSDDVDRYASSGDTDSEQVDNLSLDLDGMSDVAMPVADSTPSHSPPAATPTLSGIDAEDILLEDIAPADALEIDESIFSTDASDIRSASQTIVRSDAPADVIASASSNPSGLSMPSMGSVAGGTSDMAEVIFAESRIGDAPESEDFILESISGASSIDAASPATKRPAPAPSRIDNTLAIDLSGGGGGQRSGVTGGSDAGVSGLSGKLDSGLSLEDDIQISGIDQLSGVQTSGVDLAEGLGFDDAAPASDDRTLLGGDLSGDDFILSRTGDGDDESASVVIATDSESGDSSFFGQTMTSDGGEESIPSSSLTGDSMDFSADMTNMTNMINDASFSIWQVSGLVCCSLLLLFGGFIAYDLVRTIGSPESTTLANPLLNAMADAFGWRK